MTWRITWFTLAFALLVCALVLNKVWLVLAAIAAGFFASIKWW